MGMEQARTEQAGAAPVVPDQADSQVQSTRRPPGSRVVRFGLAVFALGVAVIAFAVIGFFLGAHDWPLWLNICCGLFAPAGFLIAFAGAIGNGRRDQRTALREVQAQPR
jgi:hypothetical protein